MKSSSCASYCHVWRGFGAVCSYTVSLSTSIGITFTSVLCRIEARSSEWKELSLCCQRKLKLFVSMRRGVMTYSIAGRSRIDRQVCYASLRPRGLVDVPTKYRLSASWGLSIMLTTVATKAKTVVYNLYRPSLSCWKDDSFGLITDGFKPRSFGR